MNWPLPIRVLLLPFAWIYGLVVRGKGLLYDTKIFRQKRLKGAVISVGNLTVGGTGKTPMVLWLAEKFLAEGKRVAILSRGYRGEKGTSDEIELLRARLGGRVRFGVGADRLAEGRKLEEAAPVDIFLLDDGFQHRQLARDVDIVLIDSTRPLHKNALLPAGSLREPPSAIARANVVLFTRVHQSPIVTPAIQRFPLLPIFPASTRLVGVRRVGADHESVVTGGLLQPVFAFCGIGNSEAFFKDLARWEISVAGKTAFRDHHAYSGEDVRELDVLAKRSGAKAFLTTEKDVQNLGSSKFSLPLYCCEIAMDIPDQEEFWRLIGRLLPHLAGASA